MKFLHSLKKLKKSFSPFNPLVEILVFKNNLLHNLDFYQKLAPNLHLAPVLKSNAYGHGLVEVAKILEGKKIAFLTVDSLYEAMMLKNNGIKNKILVIGYTQNSNIQKIKIKDTSFTITSMEQLKILSESLKVNRTFHLKVDTGMHRQGINFSDLAKALQLVKQNKHIILEGLCSHLADADGQNQEPTLTQINIWNEAVNITKKEFGELPFWHLSNSAGIFYNKKIIANTARLGIGFYGYNTDEKIKLKLKPALSIKTIITSLRNVAKAEPVGYNFTQSLDKTAKLATVPVGYFEGVDRRLSGNGYVLAHNLACPIIGRVSMNITTIDVSKIENVELEDAVEIISADVNQPNSVEKIAKSCNTIPYEILVHIPQHLRRTVV